MLPYKQKSPIKKFKEEENETGKFYLVLKILAGAKKDKDWSGVDEAVKTLGSMLDSVKENKKPLKPNKLKSLTEKVSLKDDLLSGITFENLVVTLQSNEKNPTDLKVIEKVFNELLKQNIEDAKYTFKTNVKEIQNMVE